MRLHARRIAILRIASDFNKVRLAGRFRLRNGVQPDGVYGMVTDERTVKKTSARNREAERWAKQLMKTVHQVLTVCPQADPENVRHTLILLQKPPLERLKLSLTRGRALAKRK